jgi:hypothetical protein
VTLERAVFVAMGVSGVVLSVGAAVIAGGQAATSVASGAGIALVNLWALRGIVVVLLSAASGGRSSAALGFFLVPKQLALFGLVWLLLMRHVVSAGPLALGYAALPIGVAIAALVCKNGDS